MIDAFRGDYSFLSNFYPCKIEYEGLTYNSVEAAYQASKVSSPSERLVFVGLDARSAKLLSKKYPPHPSFDRVSVMSELLRLKFYDPVLARKLKLTEPHELVEGNYWHDNFWGNCGCGQCKNIPGINMLGKLLMDVRDKTE